MKREPQNENDVKALAKDWYKAHHGWSYAPIQNGLGEHGIHDRIGCVPVVVTEAMVGKRVGLFVSIESKAPGRRGEPRRGMSKHQDLKREAIIEAAGISICCDGAMDLNHLSLHIGELVGAIERTPV